MSGGGGTQTSTTKNSLPSWAVPYAQEILGAGASQFLPNGAPGQMPQNMQQGVAGMTPDQISAMNMIEARAGVTPNAGAQPGVTTTAPPVQQAAIPGTQAAVPNPPVAAPPPPPAPVVPPPTSKKKKVKG